MDLPQTRQPWQFGLRRLLTLVTGAAIFCALLPRDSVPVVLQVGAVLVAALASFFLALLLALAPVLVLAAAVRLLDSRRRGRALLRRFTDRIDAR